MNRTDQMSFGVVLQPDPPISRVVELAVMAEDRGFDQCWLFDSHVLWPEPFVIFSQILARTERMGVGPMVTNPGTRDITVLGSLFATLDSMFPRRTLCAMGRGDSALRYIGRRPESLAASVNAMNVIRALFAGRDVDLGGTAVRIPWREESGAELPVWFAAYGPKALDVVGRHADGFVLQLADPKILEWTLQAVRDAAEDEGRDPDAITVCVVAPAYVGDDLAHQRDQLRWFGGMVGNHIHDLVMRYGEDDSKVPHVLAEYIRQRQGYDYSHHGRSGNPDTEFVPDGIVDRLCVLGPPEAHIEKLRELQSLGVDHFAVYLMHDDKEGTLAAYGEQVIPALQDG